LKPSAASFNQSLAQVCYTGLSSWALFAQKCTIVRVGLQNALVTETTIFSAILGNFQNHGIPDPPRRPQLSRIFFQDVHDGKLHIQVLFLFFQPKLTTTKIQQPTATLAHCVASFKKAPNAPFASGLFQFFCWLFLIFFFTMKSKSPFSSVVVTFFAGVPGKLEGKTGKCPNYRKAKSRVRSVAGGARA
jgi:hypothetical protein